MAKLGMCSKIANSHTTLQKPHRELTKVSLQSVVQVRIHLHNCYICITLKISNHKSKRVFFLS